MDNFELQKRYFESRLGKFETRPGIHHAQIDDCRYYLEMLEGAGTLSRFMQEVKETGSMVSTARAEIHDRYRSRIEVYRALGQEAKVLEDRQRLEIVESAQTHGELSSGLTDFEEHTRFSYNENKAMNALGSVMTAIFHLCTDPPGSGAMSRSMANFNEYWKQMREADPDVSWEKIMRYPAYRDRVIFSDAQMAVLEEKFREVCHG